MSESDDQPDEDDPALQEAAEAYQRDRDGLHDLIADYLEDFEINTADGVYMLLDIMVGLRVVAYGFGVENPSASGLKLDLDRFAREVADFLRESKKNADSAIDEIKEVREHAAEEGEEDEEEDEDEEADEGDEDEADEGDDDKGEKEK